MDNKYLTKGNIIGVCVLVFVIVVIIVLVNIQGKRKDIEKDLVEVTSYNIFYSAGSMVSEFINKINSKDNKAIYNLLDSKYKSENGISLENVLSKFAYNGDNLTFRVNSVRYGWIYKDYIYYVEGDVLSKGMDTSVVVRENMKYLLFIDYDTVSYSVYPMVDSNYGVLLKDVDDINVSKNENNEIITSNVGKNDICSIYINEFLMSVYTNTSEAYEMISDELKMSKFKSYEDFKKFVEENISKFSTTIYECNVSGEEDEDRTYKIYDKNSNYYEFVEEEIQNFKLNRIEMWS